MFYSLFIMLVSREMKKYRSYNKSTSQVLHKRYHNRIRIFSGKKVRKYFRKQI